MVRGSCLCGGVKYRVAGPVQDALNRDSPDDCRSIHAFPAFLQDRARCRRLPAPWAVRTLLEGLIWPFSLGIWTHASYRVALERMTIAGLTPARVAAAAVIPRSAAKSLGTFAVGWRPPPSERRHNVHGSRPLRRF